MRRSGGRRRGLVVLVLAWIAGTLAASPAPDPVAATSHDVPAPLRIAFASELGAGGILEIYTIATDGTGLTRLTNNTTVDTHPTWSPDGTQIAYESHDGWDIWVMNADGSGQRSLTQTPAAITTTPPYTTGTFESQPAWSPDGTRIAYFAFGEGIATSVDGGALMVMDADGTNRVQLTTDFPVQSPTWSRDGTKILFMAYSDIWSIDATGGTPVNITDTASLFESQAAWSPATDRIAYTGHVLPYDIHLMDPDGTDRVQVTTSQVTEQNASWSPDGAQLVFERAGSRTELFIVNADGSGEFRLTDGTYSGYLPAWQPMPTPTIDFDWTMPERYGDDGDGDGLIDTFPPDANGGLEIEPNGWIVDFDASPGAACDTTRERTWLLDGVEVDPSDPNVISLDADGCTFSYRFADEGTYPVGLEERDADEGTLLGSVTKDVPVQDWLIVSIGDSVASGEGNPDIPILPVWQDRQCHRSALAGPARAAQALEAADPRTSVTFIHLACSGATTMSGLLGPYEGQEPVAGSVLPPQVEALSALVGDREIDAVLVSIGANDVRFSDVVTLCLLQRDCTSRKPSSAASQFGRDLAYLPGNYDVLATELTVRGVAAERVYLAEYFDPTRDDAGAYCDRTMLADADITAEAIALGITVRNTKFLAITAEEAAWASDTMMPALNLAGTEAAARHGWNRVDGIRDPFLTHGYCAQDHWVVTYTESMARQDNKDGTLHPNAPGHELYGQRLLAGLVGTLYADGDLDRPRPPAEP